MDAHPGGIVYNPREWRQDGTHTYRMVIHNDNRTQSATALHDETLLNTLRAHIRALAGGIGPRPATTPAEDRAFTYIRGALADAGVTESRTLRFPAPRTGTGALWIPLVLAAALNLPTAPPEGQQGRLVWRLARFGGAMAALGAGKVVFDALRGARPRVAGRHGQSTTHIGMIPATGEQRARLVLLANVDSPQDSPARHATFPDRTLGTAMLAAPLLHAFAGAAAALGGPATTPGIRLGTWGGTLAAGLAALREGRQPHTPGANDNASGVAALLAVAAQLAAHPLKHTEVWLVFTGAGEAGAYGVHALLDSFGRDLTTAYFLNVTRVGSGRLFLADRYTGRSHLTGYLPSPRTLAVAEAARLLHPVLGVERSALADADAVATLTVRGYHGATLTGYDPATRIPAGWHAPDDVPGRVDVDCVERAVYYLAALANEVEARAVTST